MVPMKLKILCGFLGVLGMLAAGCVNTVSGGKTAGMPFTKDKVEGHYERSVDAVFTAAKEVIIANGTLTSESIVHEETNQVKTIVGKVNERTVYVRVKPVDASVTSVAVQTRTAGGGSDIYLAHELEKQIALHLVR
jgi:hypothetical protein